LSLISSYAEQISVDLRLFNWDGVAGISNALMVILNLVLVLGIFLSYFNLRENTKSRVLGILFRANEYIDEVKKDISVIRARATDVPEWRDDDKESIAKAASPIPDEEANKVSKVLQRLSYLVRAGFIPEKHLIEMWGPLFLEMWLLLEPWVNAYCDRIDPSFRLSGSTIRMNGLHVTHLLDPLLEATWPVSSIGQQGAASSKAGMPRLSGLSFLRLFHSMPPPH
jgi:hypothetical protein